MDTGIDETVFAVMAVAVGLLVSLLIVLTAHQRQLELDRVRRLRNRTATKYLRTSPLVAIGAVLHRLPLARRYGTTEEHFRAIALAMLIGILLLMVLPHLALLAALFLAQPTLGKRRRRQARTRETQHELPMVAEMLRLAVVSGLNISNALVHVVQYSNGPISQEFRRALELVHQGHRLADSLERVRADLVEEAQPLLNAIISSERFGAPLNVSLERIARETRRNQERRAEQAGQKLAVQLVLPVAVTTLPAFVVLTVPPVVAGSFGSLALHH